MDDVRVVFDRNSVAMGDDTHSHGWCVTVPASMLLSQVVREHVPPGLASISGLAEWLVVMAEDMTYGIGQEAYNGFPRTYCLRGKFDHDNPTPVAALVEEPDEDGWGHVVTGLEMLVPDVPIEDVTKNADGDVALYVKYRGQFELYGEAQQQDGAVAMYFRDPFMRARLEADYKEMGYTTRDI